MAVLIDKYEETPKILRISANDLRGKRRAEGDSDRRARRDDEKIGIAARQDLEKILGTKIFMELFVKVQTNWRQNASMVKQLDWHRQLEDLGNRQAVEGDDGEDVEPVDDSDDES